MLRNKVIKLENISKNYYIKNDILEVLSDINVTFEKNKFYVIMGHSGSGKTTLINILGLLDKQTEGNYYLNEIETNNLNEKELAHIRNKNIGFIFQGFLLDPNLTALDNVKMPMIINKDIPRNMRNNIAIQNFKKFGLEKRMHHYPRELSGGEQERVAIIRAIINNPDIIIADEPTGNLDEVLEKEVFEYLKMLSKEDKCIIVVTHSKEALKYADIVYKLKNKKLVLE